MTSNRTLFLSALSLAVLVPAVALAGPASPTIDQRDPGCAGMHSGHTMRGAQGTAGMQPMHEMKGMHDMADMQSMHQLKGVHDLVCMHAAAPASDTAATPATPNMTRQDLQQIWSAP